MPRRMSCSMTVPAVRDRRKTVTRRHATPCRRIEWRYLDEEEVAPCAT